MFDRADRCDAALLDVSTEPAGEDRPAVWCVDGVAAREAGRGERFTERAEAPDTTDSAGGVPVWALPGCVVRKRWDGDGVR